MKEIKRYSPTLRLNHWIVAICFILQALSGLAFFYPAFFWLTSVFGRPELARIIHPFVGVLMFVSFMVLFLRLWKFNIVNKEDIAWMLRVKQILVGNEEGLKIGRYNGGQKAMFWVMILALLVLLISGIMLWQPYFAGSFPIPLRRLAALMHALAAIGLIMSIIIHIYAAIWVQGTIRAMVLGTVTKAWARKNHPEWYREEISKKEP